ncbi:MAG: YybH family protein [Gemmatimonadaceae bacterium]
MTARFPSLALAVLLAAGCTADVPADQQGEDAAAVAAIEQIRADYVTHYNAHHASVIAEMFADSAVSLNADGSVEMGRPAIQASLEEAMKGAPTLDLKSGEVMVFGNHAVGRGTYTVTTTPPGGSAMSLAGSYMTHFTKLDGQWKISSVTTNYNAPMPEGMRQPSGAEAPPDQGTMQTVLTSFTQAFGAGDWAGLAALYDEDAYGSWSGEGAHEGRSAIQTRFTNRYAGSTSQQIEIHDVSTLELAPGWALDGGWWVVTGATGAASLDGIYMHLMRQQEDGSWKIHWAVVNGGPTLPT